MRGIGHILAVLAASSSVANALGNCTTNERKSWSSLTDDEKSAFIQAELCLMESDAQEFTSWAKNRYDEIIYTHVIQASVIHNVGAFLPWHRLFVRAHEILLQEECGYTGAQPYWDELADVDDMAGSSVFDADTGFGGDGGGSCITDGPFANYTAHVDDDGVGMSDCITRNFNTDTFSSGAAQDQITTCLATDNYVDANDCYSGSLHNAGHGGIGGKMGNVVASPTDPAFFLHHANLDRLWWNWQNEDLDTRLTEIGGDNYPSASLLEIEGIEYPGTDITDYFGDGGNVTTLNHNLWMVGLISNYTIGDVMDLQGDVICATYVE
ncbi:amino acid transporter [Xylariaceae sp. FL0016]|nr:amino acid transporter [Xylariaceae sp. FL0016]